MANCETEERVVQKLHDLFGNVLTLDVIKNVALSCKYDVNESSNKLLEISSEGNQPQPSSSSSSASTTTFASAWTNPAAFKISPNDTFQIRPSISTPVINNNKSKKARDVDRVIGLIEKGYKVLVILRGLPGSGKSYLARTIVDKTVAAISNPATHILSTDDYFYRDGFYNYDVNKLNDAHGWNHHRAFLAMSKGVSPVIIDNTNTQMWEMRPYATMATDFGYYIEILEPDTFWCFNDKELARRNSHNVEQSKIRAMLDRYQKNITVEKLLQTYSLHYVNTKPPQMRCIPPFTAPINNNNKKCQSSLSLNDRNSKSSSRESVINLSHTVAILNQQQEQQKQKGNIENINLMDFEENKEESAPLIEINDDEMLTISSNNNNPKNKDNHALFQPKNDITNNLFNGLQSWGLNEESLRSWDVVTPLQDVAGSFSNMTTDQIDVIVNYSDAATNTTAHDFNVLSGRYNCDSSSRVVETQNRNINFLTPHNASRKISQKIMLDKGCMTEENMFTDEKLDIANLIEIFPDKPPTYLKFLYSKCKKNLDWTIELVTEEQVENFVITSDEDDDDKKNGKTNNKVENSGTISDDENKECERKHKNKRRKSVDEDLKKAIESKFDINNDYYSEKLLKVKYGRNVNTVNTTACTTANEANTSNAVSSSCCSAMDVVSSTAGPSTYIPLSNKMDDKDCVEISDAESESDNTSASGSTNMEEDELMEINLGTNVLEQLERKFGEFSPLHPRGFQPIVQVPVNIARQLYTLYIESVYEQMDSQNSIMDELCAKDADLARKLQEEEERQNNQQQPPPRCPTPDLQQIMTDQQNASNAYKKQIQKIVSPDNLALRLSRQKLQSVFPKLDKDLLEQIFHSTAYNYTETVEMVLQSGVSSEPGNIREPPINENTLEEMKSEYEHSSLDYKNEGDHDAQFYRDTANDYLHKRTELVQKAQQYYQKGMTEVGQFYSDLAAQLLKNSDTANNIAANLFLEEHFQRLDSFNTLDLHYLHVKEAILALDMFLDNNISLLKTSKKNKKKKTEKLQIITGRGNRSAGGISKIRPAVIVRLKKRNIPFSTLNPGLLEAEISSTTAITNEL